MAGRQLLELEAKGMSNHGLLIADAGIEKCRGRCGGTPETADRAEADGRRRTRTCSTASSMSSWRSIGMEEGWHLHFLPAADGGELHLAAGESYRISTKGNEQDSNHRRRAEVDLLRNTIVRILALCNMMISPCWSLILFTFFFN